MSPPASKKSSDEADDDEDDEEEEKLTNSGKEVDPERLKAFNVRQTATRNELLYLGGGGVI